MIFNLFKAKPTLKELIPEGFVDIHSHVLPGIDDGAKNINESVKLISEMKKLGFGKIYATPHTYPGLYDNTNDTILKSYNSIKNYNSNKNYLKFSSEYMLNSEIINKAIEKTILCISDKYILIEMSFLNMPINCYEIIFELQLNGYKLILAHPERYLYLNNNFNDFYKLKKVGCLFQLNLLSGVGYYGKEVLSLSDKLLSEDLIDFVGSDIHSLRQINEFHKNVLLKNRKNLEKAIQNNYIFDF